MVAAGSGGGGSGGGAAGTAATLSSAFSELQKCGIAGEYDRALKICNKILQMAPDDPKALHCKVVCLIQLSNFKDAMALFRNAKYSSVTAGFHFEKAYVLYRLNLLSEALQTVDSAPELSSGLKELRAQILYRLEKYQECFSLYRDIVKNTNDDYEDERQTNMSAVYAYLSEKEMPGSQSWSELSKYEIIYNAACREAMNGHIPEAARLLQQAETAAEDFIKEDGGGEEELAEETAIIKVQKAYCLQIQGKDKEATAIYQTVLKAKPSDQALVAIASNNLVVINKETSVFDSKKRMKAATQEGLEHKLTSRQKRSILYNQALLSVYSNQNEQCKQLCSKLSKEFNLEKEAILIESSCLAKDGKITQAINLFSKHPELKLAAVHLYLSQGDRKSAIKILESPELKFKPGIIGTLVTLYLAENNREAVAKLFEEAMGHLKGNKEGGSVEEAWHSRHGGPGGPAGTRALARLVIASVGTDPKKALELSTELPPMKFPDGNVDVDTLETSNWIMGAKVVKKTTRQEQSPGTPKTDKKKTNRKRKTKLPANVDLAVPPDPERWLPRYERTAFRKRRQRGPREVIKGSQGMTTSAQDQYDMTKQQGNTSKSPRVIEKQATQSEPGWQKNKQQKKKRKGGKW